MSGTPVEQLRKEVCAALVHCIVSNRGLWETVDISEAKHRMDTALGSIPWRPLSLLPLWEYFKEVGTPEAPARETLLFFASRGARWGIAIDLPAELNALTADQRAVHVERMRSLGGSSGTFVGRAPVAPLQAVATQQPTLQTTLPRTRTPQPSPVQWNAPGIAAPAPGPRPHPTEPTIAMPPAPAPRVLGRAHAAVAAVAMAAGVLWVVASFRPGVATPAPQAALSDLCSEVVTHGHAVLCTATPAAFADPMRAAVRVEALRITLDATLIFVDQHGNLVDPIGQPIGALAPGHGLGRPPRT